MHYAFTDSTKIRPAKIRSENKSQLTAAQPRSPEWSTNNDYPDGITSRKSLASQLAVINDGAEEENHGRKRKRRKTADDDVEGRYMRSLVLEGDRDERRLAATVELSRTIPGESAHSRHTTHLVENLVSNGVEIEEEGDVESVSEEPIQHETTLQDKEVNELEKSSRTVFLANVCTSAIKSKTSRKTLMDHLVSFVPSLPSSSAQHAVESLRFRSTAFTDSGIPRKAAFIKKELMESTTRSTNAYAVYTTMMAAREAIKRLNGTVVLDRHLRVDSVSHPAEQDHRRCVFVGNLGFVDDTTAMDEVGDERSQSKPRKGKEPADAEEGLWRQFGKAGRVESVRVVRDRITRVGKGFAYVQFWDANAVEKALLLNEKKFPPMLPRILRVSRAKNFTKTKLTYDDRSKRQAKIPRAMKGPPSEAGKPSQEINSLLGRANKLLGRAGAAQIRKRPASKDRKQLMTRRSKQRAENYKNKMKQ